MMSKTVLGRKKIIKPQWEDYRISSSNLETHLYEHLNDFVTEYTAFVYRWNFITV